MILRRCQMLFFPAIVMKKCYRKVDKMKSRCNALVKCIGAFYCWQFNVKNVH